ncbi:MAG: dimethylsulfoniopropionate demethylase, partial [Rhodobacteraceae bacterium]
GTVTSAVFSPGFGCNVAIGMVDLEKVSPGIRVEVETQLGFRNARVRSEFWR